MWQLIKFELYKIIRRPRSYIGFVAITAIVSLIHLALYVDGPNFVAFFIQQLEESFDIQGKIINGNLAAWLILQTLIVQMPLLVTLVSGDLLSGESSAGTIRLLATKPVSRRNIILAKFMAGNFYTILLVIWLGIISLGIGLLIFGNGDLIVLNSSRLTIFRADDTLWRFGVSLLIACLSLSVISTLSMMFSSFTDNSIGPIVATMAIVIIFTIIGTMDFPLFEKISPFLFTTHMIVWRSLFEDPVDANQVFESVTILIGHILLFLGITFYYFNRKDILN
ncbi:MAG: ABC transporter permease, partial [Chitinophagales bacterium]